MHGDDVTLLSFFNVGVAEFHTVLLGLTKAELPCHQHKTLKPGTKVTMTTTQCKTPAKARVNNALDENGPRLLLLVAQCNGVNVEYLVESIAMHSFVRQSVVAWTGCTTTVAPILSVTLADENAVLSDSIYCLDLMLAVGTTTKYSMSRVPCHVLPLLTSNMILGMDWLLK